jgi:TPR repeat protein
MKLNSLRSKLFILFFINLYAFGIDIEDMDNNIKGTTNVALKQVLICERETVIDRSIANPNVCLKAVEYFKNINETNKEMESEVQLYIYLNYTRNNPDFIFDKTKYKLYLEEYKAKYISESYLNAAILYQFSGKYQNYKKAFESYKKSYDIGECNSSTTCSSGLNLGYFYLTGKGGIDKNLVLGYKYTKESADKGNSQASKNLEYVCSANPWVCN